MKNPWYAKYTSVLNPNQCQGDAARTIMRDYAIGEGAGAVVGGVVGGLVAAGATEATDTYPFAGQTVPSGVVAGTMVGTAEALPLTTLGALADGAWTYFSCKY